jgi:hypothetical protein
MTETPETDALIAELKRNEMGFQMYSDDEILEETEKHARSLETRLRAAERDAARLREVLRELVALKDLHDRIERGFSHPGEGMEYTVRKPGAWKAARAVLAGSAQEE